MKVLINFMNNLHVEEKLINHVNFWMNKKETISEWHFDSFDNFLIAFQGGKNAYLLDPNSE